MIAKARRERSQIMTETVASARQANQKSMLIARKEELDATKDSASEMVGSANLKGRSDLLKSLFVEAKRDGGKKKGKGMVMRPVGIDRTALEDAGDGFEFGDDIDGLGGFVLEKRDGSVILDYRFDGRFEKSWVTALPMVTSVLFGDE
jgi:vacuolar-type H+-ATPase subunit E/Vma4